MMLSDPYCLTAILSNPYYLVGLAIGVVLVVALSWLGRRHVVARRILVGITQAIDELKDNATPDEALTLRGLTNAIASTMQISGTAKALDKHLEAAGHNEGEPLREAISRRHE